MNISLCNKVSTTFWKKVDLEKKKLEAMGIEPLTLWAK